MDPFRSTQIICIVVRYHVVILKMRISLFNGACDVYGLYKRQSLLFSFKCTIIDGVKEQTTDLNSVFIVHRVLMYLKN